MKKLITYTALSIAIFSGHAFGNNTFKLTSPDIIEGSPLNTKHVLNSFGCTGDNISPALTWDGVPKGTKSFAITVYDPDAPTGSGWWHWVVFNLPANITHIKQGIKFSKDIVQSKTDFGTYGFGGACPPSGEMHRYEFKVHALSTEKINLTKDSSAALVGFMLNANTIDTAKITAVYTR